MTPKFEVWLSKEKTVTINAEDLEHAYEVAESKFAQDKWNIDKVQTLE